MSLCVIFGCGNRSDQDNKRFSFTTIPAVRHNHGKLEYRRSLKRRIAWIVAISQDDINEDHMENYMICSKHFHSGKPAKDWDETN